MKRRTLLKGIGGTAVGLGISTTKVAAKGGSSRTDGNSRNKNRNDNGKHIHGVRINFNPNSREQLTQFFEDLQELSEDEAADVLKSLRPPQARAVEKVIKKTEIVIEDTSLESGFSLMNSGSTSVSGKAVGKHYLTRGNVFTLEYEVEWDYDEGEDEISNVYEYVRPNTYDPTWSHKGEVSSGCWMVEKEDSWNGRIEHVFSFMGVGPIDPFTVTPWVELEGDSSGDGNVVSTGDYK